MNKFKSILFLTSTTFLFSCGLTTENKESISEGDSEIEDTFINHPVQNESLNDNIEEGIYHDVLKVGNVTFTTLKDLGGTYSWTFKEANTSEKTVAQPITSSEKVFKANIAKPGKYNVELTANGETYKTEINVPATNKLSISLNDTHTFISEENSKTIYSYGNNDFGKLCVNPAIKNIIIPTKIDGILNPEQVATGKNHTLIKDGSSIKACGSNEYGQLGLVDNSLNTSTPIQTVDLPSTVTIDGIIRYNLKAGGNMSALEIVKNIQGLTSPNGYVELYQWGYRVSDKNDKFYEVTSVPGFKSGLEAVNTSFTVGNDFFTYKIEGNNLLSYGRNDLWQLGRIENRGTFTKIENKNILDNINPAIKGNFNKNKNDWNEGLVYTAFGEEGRDINDLRGSFDASGELTLASGKDFTIALKKSLENDDSTKNKYTVYAWGNNDKGQLGFYNYKNGVTSYGNPIGIIHGNNSNTDYSTGYISKEKFINANIIKIAAGSAHALALDSDGKLYGWGDNSKMQLTGNPTRNLQNNAVVEIANIENVKYTDIWAGGDRTIILGHDGNLYTWGDNTNGVLGIQYKNDKIGSPKKILFKAKNISNTDQGGGSGGGSGEGSGGGNPKPEIPSVDKNAVPNFTEIKTTSDSAYLVRTMTLEPNRQIECVTGKKADSKENQHVNAHTKEQCNHLKIDYKNNLIGVARAEAGDYILKYVDSNAKATKTLTFLTYKNNPSSNDVSDVINLLRTDGIIIEQNDSSWQDLEVGSPAVDYEVFIGSYYDKYILEGNELKIVTKPVVTTRINNELEIACDVSEYQNNFKFACTDTNLCKLTITPPKTIDSTEGSSMCTMNFTTTDSEIYLETGVSFNMPGIVEEI